MSRQSNPRQSNSRGRGPSVLWPCALLALALTAHAAHGKSLPRAPQDRRLPTELRLPPTTHHVKGRLVRGRCEQPLAGVRLKVVEYWYVGVPARGDVREQRLGFPDRALIVSTGARLEQGRVLGELTLRGPDGGDFDVQWGEVVFGNRVPWRSNVVYVDANDPLTAYRMLALEVSPVVGPYMFDIAPVPFITFFGAEAVKNVGEVKINCSYLGG